MLDATPELLQKVGQEAAGVKLTVKKEDIVECTNLRKLIETYKVQGGPSPAEVERSIKSRNKILLQAKTNVSKLQENLANAEKTLKSTVESYSQSNPSKSGRLKNSNL